MHYRQLGNSDIKVSVLGLGTMTWGHQNSESDAHQQIELALAEGINLIDTAEMYSHPCRHLAHHRALHWQLAGP